MQSVGSVPFIYGLGVGPCVTMKRLSVVSAADKESAIDTPSERNPHSTRMRRSLPMLIEV